MSDRYPNRPPTPRPLADNDDTAVDDTAVDDTIADRTLIVDMEPTRVDNPTPVIVDTERTEVDNPARPMTAEEEESHIQHSPSDAMPNVEDLRRLGQLVAMLSSQVGHWLGRRLLRPGIRQLEVGLTRLIALFRKSRAEDSDAYSRRRGQQWHRFREGDPNINELREFDEKHRAPRKRDS